jgi:hypothetical protein
MIWAPPVDGGCLRDMIEGLEYLLRMGNEFVGPGSQHAFWQLREECWVTGGG